MNSKILTNELNLKKLYDDACQSFSDIYMHLPILYEYAKKCDHVTEMGARGGNSTCAFLYSNPKKFVSYDYQYENPEPHLEHDVKKLISIFESAKEQGINCEYIGADVLSIEIEDTDFLFIDTWHCYEQLKRELQLHAGKVKKYIAFHDTYTYGQKGEGYPHLDPNHPQKDNFDGTGGIRLSIDEFLQSNSNWEIEYETEQNNGLIIISNKVN
jgi:hypothetical protein